MENNTNWGFAKVKSQKLLKIMAQRRLLGLLAYVNITDDSLEYGFVNKPEVQTIYNAFVQLYGRDNVSFDEPDEWKYFNAELYRHPDECNLITVSDYATVMKIIENGYGASLVKTFKNKQNNIKYFQFISRDEINEIVGTVNNNA